MLSLSSSLFNHHRILSSPLLLRRRRISTSITCIQRNHRPRPPSKSILKSKDFLFRRDNHSLSSPPPLLPTQSIALVAASQANFFRVIVQQSTSPSHVSKQLLCVVRALMKKMRRRVLVGDIVLVGSVDWNDGRGVIEDVFRRNTEVLDPPVANVNHLLVVFSMEQPKLEPFTLTRFLVEAESTDIPLTLVLNKEELVAEETLSSWRERLHSWGYKPLFCSVDRKSGLDTLDDILRGKTTVVFGPSGAGKSSLINSLRMCHNDAEEVEVNDLPKNGASNWLGVQRIGTVSKRGQGKHTTRNICLLPLSEGGYLCDTPGFNQPSLMKVTKRSLADMFPEIRQRLAGEPGRCRFHDCLHLGEPGCVVNADWERYPYYLQLLDEIKIREEFQLRTFGTKREGDVRYKTGAKGVKQAEPRLEMKKHRRVSRKQRNQLILDDLDNDFEDDVCSDIGADDE